MEAFRREWTAGVQATQRSTAARVRGVWPQLELAFSRFSQGALGPPCIDAECSASNGHVEQSCRSSLAPPPAEWLHLAMRASQAYVVLFIGPPPLRRRQEW